MPCDTGKSPTTDGSFPQAKEPQSTCWKRGLLCRLSSLCISVFERWRNWSDPLSALPLLLHNLMEPGPAFT